MVTTRQFHWLEIYIHLMISVALSCFSRKCSKNAGSYQSLEKLVEALNFKKGSRVNSELGKIIKFISPEVSLIFGRCKACQKTKDISLNPTVIVPTNLR